MLIRRFLSNASRMAVWGSLTAVSNVMGLSLYSIQDIGPAGRTSLPGRINENGAAVFWLANGDTPQISVPGVAMLYDGSTSRPLASLGGSNNGAFDVNNEDTAVGHSTVAGSAALWTAVRYLNGHVEELGVANGGQSTANAINDMGQIVGAGQFGNGYYAYLWNGPGEFQVLGSLGGSSSYPNDINNHGVTVGDSELAPDPSGAIHSKAFVYENGQMTALDVFGSQNSTATAINERGQIVGGFVLGNSGIVHPFFFDPQTGMHDIGLPGMKSGAWDINEFGVIVGSAQRAPDSNFEAFVYDSGSGLKFLQELISTDSGWAKLNYAHSINDRGQILGQGVINDELHVFLATPIPEPSTAWLVLISLLLTWIPIRSYNMKRNQRGRSQSCSGRNQRGPSSI